MMKILNGLCVVILGIAISGCGGSGDSVPESTTTLTQSEQAALADASGEAAPSDFSGALQTKVVTSATRSQLVNGMGTSIDIDNEVENCAEGGTVTTNGTITIGDFSGDDVSTNFDQTAVYADCGVRDEATSNILTLNGTLDGSGSSSFDLADEDFDSFNVTFNLTGALEVSGNANGDGTCGIGLELQANGSSGTISGTVCGETYNETIEGL